MVRLRRWAQAVELLTGKGFNPTMVRLRLYYVVHISVVTGVVSIPLWCDCDAGTLGVAKAPKSGFNPTMVRLRRGLQLMKLSVSLVSIPLWCDCDR